MLLIHHIVAPPPGAPPGSEVLYAGADNAGGPRDQIRVDAGTTLSLDTYVNALPVAHWTRWAGVSSLRFVATVFGHGALVLNASGPTGQVREVWRAETALDGTVLDVEVTPEPTDVWLWLEVAATHGPLRVAEAAWWVDRAVRSPAVGVGITTYNRPDECLAALRAIADEPGLVARVTVVDQGDQRVSARPGFGDVEAALAGRLRVVTQPNFGGSGGFARAMMSLLADDDVSHVLLLDDDVVLDPEAVRRLATFAAVAGDDVVVGGQMLHLTAPTVLHTTGEVVEPRRFWWQAAPGADREVELAGVPASSIPALGRPTDVDFNGWWMCLIPRPVVEDLGLPLPLFIKWDDAEYGLRARSRGYRVVTLPGAGLWHMPWTAKDTSRDWQAFYLSRNRLVVAALHAGGRPIGLVVHLAAQTVGHLVSMAYSAADLTLFGMEEFLEGPQRLWESQREGLAPVHRRRQGHVDADPGAAQDALPRAVDLRLPAPPARPATTAVTAVAALLRAFTSSSSTRSPLVRVPLADARWTLLGRLDHVLVAGPDGRPSSLRVRDARCARDLLVRTVVSSCRVLVRWPRLRTEYRARLLGASAAEDWRHVLPR